MADQSSNNPSSGFLPPPPPEKAELKIRTMKEDLERMGKSLANTATMNVSAPVFIEQKEAQKEEDKTMLWIWAVVGAAAVVVIFFASFFILPVILKKTPPVPGSDRPTAGGSLPISMPTSTAIEASPIQPHRSFLHKPADASIVLSEDTLKNPDKKINDLIKEGFNPGVNFQEVQLISTDDGYLGWTKFMGLTGINTGFDENFWQSKFEDDFTMFVFKEGSEYLSGYILKLKKGQSPLVLQPNFLKLEESTSSLATFFPAPPGDIKVPFKDIQVSGQPVREGTLGTDSTFTYGWVFNQYLVVSLSESGLREAMLRL